MSHAQGTPRPTPRYEVDVSSAQTCLAVVPAGIADWVRSVLEHEKVAAAALSIVIMDDPAIHALNRRHLGHDWETDVITFPLSAAEDPTLAGEIVVSAETAIRQAVEHGHEAAYEIGLYLAHGILHLLGHDDHAAADRLEMRRKEAEIMESLGPDRIRALVRNPHPPQGG